MISYVIIHIIYIHIHLKFFCRVLQGIWVSNYSNNYDNNNNNHNNNNNNNHNHNKNGNNNELYFMKLIQ